MIEDPLDPEIKDLRFGDGLGCPSPDRKYRDRGHQISEPFRRVDHADEEPQDWPDENPDDGTIVARSKEPPPSRLSLGNRGSRLFLSAWF